MNFSIYINDALGRKLDKIAKSENVSRNKLITEAIARLVAEKETVEWSEEILNWQGCPEFELPNRGDLVEPREEVF